MRKNLQQARTDKKLFQREVADYLGMATKAYQRIETGTRGTTEDNWLNLFNLFDGEVPLNELMKNTSREEKAAAAVTTQTAAKGT